MELPRGENSDGDLPTAFRINGVVLIARLDIYRHFLAPWEDRQPGFVFTFRIDSSADHCEGSAVGGDSRHDTQRPAVEVHSRVRDKNILKPSDSLPRRPDKRLLPHDRSVFFHRGRSANETSVSRYSVGASTYTVREESQDFETLPLPPLVRFALIGPEGWPEQSAHYR